jgi:hypothetical protein
MTPSLIENELYKSFIKFLNIFYFQKEKYMEKIIPIIPANSPMPFSIGIIPSKIST